MFLVSVRILSMLLSEVTIQMEACDSQCSELA